MIPTPVIVDEGDTVIHKGSTYVVKHKVRQLNGCHEYYIESLDGNIIVSSRVNLKKVYMPACIATAGDGLNVSDEDLLRNVSAIEATTVGAIPCVIGTADFPLPRTSSPVMVRNNLKINVMKYVMSN